MNYSYLSNVWREAHLELRDLLLVLLDKRVGVDNFLLLSMQLEESSQYNVLAG